MERPEVVRCFVLLRSPYSSAKDEEIFRENILEVLSATACLSASGEDSSNVLVTWRRSNAYGVAPHPSLLVDFQDEDIVEEAVGAAATEENDARPCRDSEASGGVSVSR